MDTKSIGVDYILLDVTSLTATRFLHRAPLREITQLSHRYEGRKLYGPPIEGKSFSKLSLEQLQYLYWNTEGKAPPSVYADLIAWAVETAKRMPDEDVPLRRTRKITPELSGESPKAFVPPRTGSVKEKVWTICEKLYSANKDTPRAEYIAACVDAGINLGTASARYSAWHKTI